MGQEWQTVAIDLYTSAAIGWDAESQLIKSVCEILTSQNMYNKIKNDGLKCDLQSIEANALDKEYNFS